LRQASETERRQFLVLFDALIRADAGHVSPSEFALYSILHNALASPSELKANLGGMRQEQLDQDVADLLTLIARAGHDDEEMARKAYETAISCSPVIRYPFQDKAELSPERISNALSRLALTAPPYRKKILRACNVAVQHDYKITPVENELLRAFAQSLDVPRRPS